MKGRCGEKLRDSLMKSRERERERERERQRIYWDIDKTGERIFINMHSDQNECILEDRSRSTIRKSPVFGFHSENEI